MRYRASRLSVILGLLLFTLAVTFGQASLSGTVRDSSGGVLPGVSVEASSPVLIEKVRSVTTDETGQYRIVDLRPGVYKITFALSGFSTIEREGIELTGSFSATVNAELKVGALEERLTVTGATPVVDLENTRQQRVVTEAVISAIPSSRTALSVATLIPGVIGNFSDVGGTNSVGNQQLYIHGGRTTDFKITIDGFGTGNSYNHVTGMLPNLGSSQEITVDMAASSAEQSAGGIVVNVVPKDGGNQFTGSFFGSWANRDLQGDNFTTRVQDKGLAVVNSLKKVYDQPLVRWTDQARQGVVLCLVQGVRRRELYRRDVLQPQCGRPQRVDVSPRHDAPCLQQPDAICRERPGDVAGERQAQDERLLGPAATVRLPAGRLHAGGVRQRGA